MPLIKDASLCHNCLTCRWANFACNDSSITCTAPVPAHAAFTCELIVYEGKVLTEFSTVTDCPAWQTKEAQEGAGE